jgi:outer membrane lipoprotein SlyB
MCRKYMLFFLITLAFSQTSCSLHSGSTYDREEMGQPQSFSKGVIISVRNVKIKGTESGVGIVSGAVMGGLAGSQVGSNDATSAIAAIGGALVGGLIGSKAEEMAMKDSAAEFAIQPDIGEPFTFIQENEEELKSGERVLIINSDKMRIIRDQTMKK